MAKNQVRVVKEEAVGMYEVAVLEAGSAAALKKWVDEHGYQFPDGMDDACNDYVKQGWCFVAVKTNVGQKGGVAPKPGQRQVNAKLPAGSTFDGFVQAPRLGRVVRENSGHRQFAFSENVKDAPMDLLAPTVEKALICRVTYQCVFEDVVPGFAPARKHQLGMAQTLEGCGNLLL